MDVIIYTDPNGTLMKVIPVKGFSAEAVLAKDVPNDASGARIVDDSELPSRVLRGAWKDDGSIGIDLPKAKEIAHTIRRAKREAYMKDNIELINKDAIGIPLVSGQSVVTAKQDNADYKANIDDVMQTTIDAARSEGGILGALGL